MTTTATKKVPIDACHLRGGNGLLQFELLAGDAAQPQVKREWSMLANTGKTMQRWWGGLVLDLDGATFSQRLALLLDHDTQQRLGFSTEVRRTARGLEARGKLLASDLAAQVQKDSADGFPWQASLMAVPSRVQELDQGEEALVNGQTVQGPLTIFREWTLRELTLTVLGADGDTATEAFATSGEIECLTMTKQNEVPGSPANLTPQVPPATPQAPASQPNTEQLAASITAERKRASEILRHCAPEQLELGQKLVNDGASLQEALSAILQDTRTRLTPPRQGTQSLAGGNAADSGAPSAEQKLAAMPEGEEKWKAQFAASAELRQEFLGDEKRYLALKRAEARKA